jgi:hypothetical protein
MALNRNLCYAAAYAAFFEILVNDGGSVFDFMEETGLHRNTVRKLLMVMRNRKLIHIASWTQDSAGRWVLPVYALGNKPDKKRPAPLTGQQRSARAEARRIARLIGFNAGAGAQT